MKMRPFTKSSASRIIGFSLVEVMVGLVIGMLAAIIILQVFALSGSQQRNAAGSGDAQSNGSIAFYQMQRNMAQGGYGFSIQTLFNCKLKWSASSTGTLIATAVPLAPVTVNPDPSVIPAGDANTDTLLVMYGNTNQEPQGVKIEDNNPAPNNYKVGTPSAFAQNDRIFAAPSTCTAATNLSMDTVTVVDTTTKIVTTQTGAIGTTLYNLGSSPSVVAYAVRNGNLTMCDYMVNDCGLSANKNNTSIWLPIANNIVSMRAQYFYDNLTPAYRQTSPITACGWTHIPVIRIALVARNTEYNRDEVTSDTVLPTVPVPNAPIWMGTEGADADAAVPIDLTENPDGSNNPDWKHYRYKVFQSATPIRNVSWMDKSLCP